MEPTIDPPAAVVDAVRIIASAANGGMDIDAGTGGITIDSTGGISIDAATASNFSAAAGDLTLAAATNSVVVSAAEATVDAIQLTAVGGITATTGALAATTGFHVTQAGETAAIQVGTGVPIHIAPKGSLYINTTAVTTTTRLYIETDGAGTWANFTTSV